MNTASRLKLCNRSLGCVLILMLVSGIQLEATFGQYSWSVWMHIILGILLTILSLRHIYLHYRNSNWFARFAKNRNTVTRMLWWVFLLTAITGLASTAIWLGSFNHSHFGAVHGKIGFLMVLLAVIHVIRHKKNRHKNKSGKAIRPSAW